MISSLCLLLLLQVPAAVPQAGSVTGTIRLDSGLPAGGFRVAARPVEAVAGDVLYALTAANSAGRFVLQNVPPGRYYIVAGRLDRLTFYPGTADSGDAAIVNVEPNGTVTGVDFTLLKESAVADSRSSGTAAVNHAALPIVVEVEGGGTLPDIPTVQLTTKQGRIAVPATPIYPSGVTVDLLPGEYRVDVANLSPGYVVKSVMFRSKEVKPGTDISLPPPPGPFIPTFTGEGDLQQAVNRAVQSGNRLTITIGPAEK